MGEDERQDAERRLRRAAVNKAMQQPPAEPDGSAGPEEDEEPAVHRMEQQALWADLQVRHAMARGDFDDLPGAGKPLRLPDRHDPDWWVKSLIEREKITGVLPPALALRKEDAGLRAVLDQETTESGVRRTVEDFNRRVVEARRQLLGGPPVVTATRDVEQEVRDWRARRDERRRRQRDQATAAEELRASRRSRWWRRR